MAFKMNVYHYFDEPINAAVDAFVNRSIRGARVDEATGQIVLIFNDGSTYTVPGRVVGRGIKSIILRSDRRLIFTMDDGTTVDAGPLPRDVSDLAKSTLLDILRNGVYATDQTANLNTLAKEFGIDEVIIPKYTLSGNLTNCESSIPMGTSFTAGSGLTLTLTPKDGYTMDGAAVTVTMDSEDITESVYSGGVVNIAEVTGNITITAVAVAEGDKTYFVYQALVYMTSSQPERVEVNEGDSYEAVLTPKYGYTLGDAEMSVKMGNEDITASAYSGGRVYIEAVTGEVHIEGVAAEMVKHAITNNLTGVTSNNTASSIYTGKPYSAKLSALTGYTMSGAKVYVSMGDVDITESAYSDGSIFISAVTGDIVITVEAVEIKSYSIKYMLTGCASTNTVETVNAGSIFITNIASLVGYNTPTITVTMGGADVTASVVNGTAISITSVAGDIVITAVAEKIPQDFYQVSATTGNCTVHIYEGTSIPAGGSCTGYFEPAANFSMDGASVQIMMGDRDITDYVYDPYAASFEITEVTDNITIVAVAIAELS